MYKNRNKEYKIHTNLSHMDNQEVHSGTRNNWHKDLRQDRRKNVKSGRSRGLNENVSSFAKSFLQSEEGRQSSWRSCVLKKDKVFIENLLN